MPGRFGTLQVTMEPWAAEYGPQWRADDPLEEPGSAELLDIEVPLAGWAPIVPDTGPAPGTVAFVDGVRRADAFLAVAADNRLTRGLFGTCAAGAAVVRNRAAVFGPDVVQRSVICGDGLSLPAPLLVMPAVRYEPLSAAAGDPEGLMQILQTQMRANEARLARELAEHEDTLVLADGPLAYVERSRGATVGYIKSIRQWPVPAAAVRVIHDLPPGTRSPLAVMKSGGRPKYTWFIRLAAPWPGDAPFAGIVRLEVSQEVGADAAKRLADACARLLPRFAPPRGTDPRAPANLLPIGAVERQLRRRMGDALLIHRRIRALIVEEAQHGR